jgi:hypothetical protein
MDVHLARFSKSSRSYEKDIGAKDFGQEDISILLLVTLPMKLFSITLLIMSRMNLPAIAGSRSVIKLGIVAENKIKIRKKPIDLNLTFFTGERILNYFITFYNTNYMWINYTGVGQL